MKKMPAVVNLRASLDNSTLNTLRIDLSYGFRVPIIDGTPTFQGMWRADLSEVGPAAWITRNNDGARVYRKPQAKFLGTFCTDSSKDETPADLLRQVADIYDAGELKVGT